MRYRCGICDRCQGRGHDSMKTLYLMRHGQTEFNVQKIVQGQCDSPLTKAGKDQAREAALKLAQCGVCPDRIAASPLGRAYRTCVLVRDVLCESLGVALPEVETCQDLEERNYGSFERGLCPRFQQMSGIQVRNLSRMAERGVRRCACESSMLFATLWCPMKWERSWLFPMALLSCSSILPPSAPVSPRPAASCPIAASSSFPTMSLRARSHCLRSFDACVKTPRLGYGYARGRGL